MGSGSVGRSRAGASGAAGASVGIAQLSLQGAAELAAVAVALALTQIVFVRLLGVHAGDVALYYRYAQGFWTEYPLFHTLPVEYPLLSLVPFSLTLVPPGLDPDVLFAVWMGLLILLGYAGFLHFGTRRQAVAYAVYLILGAGATVMARFDIVPALVTLAALWAAERRRFPLVYALLAVGILLKLYPAFLVPVVMIEQWRDRRSAQLMLNALGMPWHGVGAGRVARDASLCAGLVIVGFLAALLLNPQAALSTFHFLSQRPLELESVPASLMWFGSFLGFPDYHDFSFSSHNAVGPLDTILQPLATVALIGGCLWVYWRQLRGGLAFRQAFLACLCVVAVTSKVFNPQYLIWLLPLAAAVQGFDLRWLAICLLTTMAFPFIRFVVDPLWTTTISWQLMLLLALRNGLLVYMTVRTITRGGTAASTEPGTGLSLAWEQHTRR